MGLEMVMGLEIPALGEVQIIWFDSLKDQNIQQMQKLISLSNGRKRKREKNNIFR